MHLSWIKSKNLKQSISLCCLPTPESCQRPIPRIFTLSGKAEMANTIHNSCYSLELVSSPKSTCLILTSLRQNLKGRQDRERAFASFFPRYLASHNSLSSVSKSCDVLTCQCLHQECHHAWSLHSQSFPILILEDLGVWKHGSSVLNPSCLLLLGWQEKGGMGEDDFCPPWFCWWDTGVPGWHFTAGASGVSGSISLIQVKWLRSQGTGFKVKTTGSCLSREEIYWQI